MSSEGCVWCEWLSGVCAEVCKDDEIVNVLFCVLSQLVSDSESTFSMYERVWTEGRGGRVCGCGGVRGGWLG